MADLENPTGFEVALVFLGLPIWILAACALAALDAWEKEMLWQRKHRNESERG